MRSVPHLLKREAGVAVAADEAVAVVVALAAVVAQVAVAQVAVAAAAVPPLQMQRFLPFRQRMVLLRRPADEAVAVAQQAAVVAVVAAQQAVVVVAEAQPLLRVSPFNLRCIA